jgi:hypothetical protein
MEDYRGDGIMGLNKNTMAVIVDLLRDDDDALNRLRDYQDIKKRILEFREKIKNEPKKQDGRRKENGNGK